ncbi:hypothetical protein BCR35DRAFT_120097 [Leucosporidium creatinivorum]|uniref:Uncharacterized protein n=1 Tax=Leucosporidium creatinivorum TaxID=106004 RepID=A0A1Y2EY44_9BASI|nr:hypothetical protein BCR35DRAFT_120097 [Leucosporidium creatinivorum]
MEQTRSKDKDVSNRIEWIDDGAEVAYVPSYEGITISLEDARRESRMARSAWSRFKHQLSTPAQRPFLPPPQNARSLISYSTSFAHSHPLPAPQPPQPSFPFPPPQPSLPNSPPPPLASRQDAHRP